MFSTTVLATIQAHGVPMGHRAHSVKLISLQICLCKAAEAGVYPFFVLTGLGPNAVPDCLPHGLAPHPQHPQHPFPMPPLPQLIQDPLYPGFPHNDKDEPVQPPYFSVERSGKDLPKGTRLLLTEV